MNPTFIQKSFPIDGLVVLTISRPDALNALNVQIFKELKYFFTQGYQEIHGLSGVIITGAGEKAFVAGADIVELNSLDAESAMNLITRGHLVMDLIEGFHVPVIAAVNGYALGGGLELAMACHLRIASPNSQFGLPELKLGLIPGYGGTQRLMTYVGKTIAMEMMLTSDFIDAEKALQNGLVNRIVPLEQLIEVTVEILKKISKRGPLAVAKAIQVINAYGADGMNQEKSAFNELLLSPEGKEGTSAFLEKRKPNFKWK